MKYRLPILLASLLFVGLAIGGYMGIARSRAATIFQSNQAIYEQIPTESGKINFLNQSGHLSGSVDPELVELDKQIITCDAGVDNLLSKTPTYGSSCLAAGGSLTSTAGMFLGGQCCGTLTDTHEYHDNLSKLQAFKAMAGILLDPMHTPIAMAKMWIDYDLNTTLTPGEQKTFDKVYGISKEKPCCCRCWHYYTNEGIAKRMITDGTFSVAQIAAYWDAATICGV
jgi:hypothetical protein